nr:hypothetical protein [uncultured Celeribacter sp.]
MPSIKFLSVVLCEDVRREASGQATIVGASIIGPSLHSEDETEISRLGFYLEAEISDVKEIEFRLSALDFEDYPIEVSMDFEFENDADDDTKSIGAVIVFNHERVKFKGPGMYQLQYKYNGISWEPVKDIYFPKRQD